MLVFRATMGIEIKSDCENQVLIMLNLYVYIHMQCTVKCWKKTQIFNPCQSSKHMGSKPGSHLKIDVLTPMNAGTFWPQNYIFFLKIFFDYEIFWIHFWPSDNIFLHDWRYLTHLSVNYTIKKFDESLVADKRYLNCIYSDILHIWDSPKGEYFYWCL